MEGLYFEDFTEGKEFISAGRTITETDVVLFASITGDNNAVHTNEHFARQTIFGGRIAHGLLSLSMAQGLLQRLGILNETGMAYLSVSDCRFLAPVRLGDTVYCKATVVGRRETKKADRGIITFQLALFNQKDEEVLSSEHAMMVKRKSNV